jgi:hypothetical protein
MAEYVKRAAFYEGQFVGAADLNLTVSYDRDAFARHERLQHTWGIVAGLGVVPADRTTGAAPQEKKFQEMTLDPGVAVDGRGRVIVVTEPTRLPEDAFIDAGVAISQVDAAYPVFVQGRDEDANESSLGGDCQSASPNRANEKFEIVFGRVNDAANHDPQQEVDVIDGAPGSADTPWRVLVGFVQFDRTIGKFTKFLPSSEGVGRRYAGVRAADVIAIGDRLVLRTGELTEAGAPALQLSKAKDDKSQLQFGPQGAGGALTPVMTVDTDGNLTVTGKIVGALAGGVQVQSGVAVDGMLLPLPPGITQQKIDSGAVAIQSQVTPRFQIPIGLAAAELFFPHFYECLLDQRRVRCRVRWIPTKTGTAAAAVDLPGVVRLRGDGFPQGQGRLMMADKMSLILFDKTSHVLGAFTRAVDSGGDSTPQDVAGDGLILRDASSGAEMAHVPPQLLKVMSIDRRDDVILRFRNYVVDDGVAQEKGAITTAAPLAYAAGTLTLKIQNAAPKDLEAWVQLEDGVSQPIVLKVDIVETDTDGTAPVTLSPGDYNALVLVPGYASLLFKLTV